MGRSAAELDDPGPHRPEPRGHQDLRQGVPPRGPAAHRGRRAEVLHEGRLHAAQGRQAALHARADPRDGHGLHARRRPSRSATRSACTSSASSCPNIFVGSRGAALGRRARRTPRTGTSRSTCMVAPLGVGILYVFAHVGAGDHRRGDRRLVERQQVQPDGRAARREPDGLATRSRWACRSSAR